ncbi:PGF-CTERM sorting domain-containing protein, partial [Halorubrum sp. SS5]
MTPHTPPERLLVCLVVATVALAPLAGGAAALGASPAAGPTSGGADADLGHSTAVAQTDAAGELTLNVTNETDDTVTVTLETTATDVAGYQAHLTFDPDATAVESVSGGAGAFDVSPVTNVDSENGSVRFNAVAGNGSEGVDAPTMATVVFDAPDATTEVSFVAADSLLSTSDAEAVTDLARSGVTLTGDGGDDGDGGDGSDGSDGTGGAPGGGSGGGGSDGGDAHGSVLSGNGRSSRGAGR